MKILYFGIAQEIAQKRSEELLVELPVTVNEIRCLLVNKYPKLKDLNSFAFAVDECYVDDDRIVSSHDLELAIIPPVSGG